MTRDSAVVTAIDDRCHSHISVVPNVSTIVTMSNRSTNSDITFGDEGSSPKSSSVLSTTSNSMISDDDCPVKCVNAYNCHKLLSSIRKQKVDDNLDQNPFGSRKTNNSASIGGRLTFYKDGKFICQLAAHQNSYENGSTKISLCRWIPVSTEFQHQKTNISNIEKWSQRPQNKTIWPCLVVNPSSNLPQERQLSLQPSLVKSEGRWNHQCRKSMMPLLLTSDNAIDVVIPNTSCSVVMAATTNIVRRPRKCSTTNLFDHGTINLQHLIYQHPQCQSSQLSQNQHQTFMMYANNIVKAQRRMLLFTKKWYNKTTAISKLSLPLQKQRKPLVNLETIVRYLWCRRDTSELFVRRKVSFNNSIVNSIASADPINSTHLPSHLIAGKRCYTAISTDVSFSTMSMNRNNNPRKKYKMERELVIRPKPTVTLVSSNNHSITAILSGDATAIGQTKRKSNSPDRCFITTSKPAASRFTLQKNFPSSLLRTLLKNSSEESSGGSSLTNNSNIVGGGNEYFQSHVYDNQKRSVDKKNGQPNDTDVDAGLIIDSVHRLPPILHHPVTSGAGQLAASYLAAATGIYSVQLPSLKSELPSSQFPAGDPWQLISNSRHILPPSPEVVRGSGVTSNKLSSYSSLGTSVTGGCFLPRNISLQPLSICSHKNLLVKQQYRSSAFGDNGEDRIKEMKNIVGLDCSFTDCVPLNLSKNSVTENVESPTNNTPTVR